VSAASNAARSPHGTREEETSATVSDVLVSLSMLMLLKLAPTTRANIARNVSRGTDTSVNT
jgi:hypothetical protein